MKARAGKEPAFLYYLRRVGHSLLPRAVCRLEMKMTLRGWERRPDAGYIRDRVDFYCRRGLHPEGGSICARDVRHGLCPSAYVYDLNLYLRAFPGSQRLDFFGGDTFFNPQVPTVMKTRRLDDLTDNGVLLNLDRRRHFLKPCDPIPFEEKEPRLFFRGEMEGKPRRRRFLELWKDSPLMDIADTNRPWDAPGHGAPVALPDHFRYRYILVLEGGDVASALQWVMMSGCVPVMPAPTVEGWLMHSRMEPDVHYIRVRDDYSDAEEKIRYYNAHPDEAKRIAEASRRWALQFADSRREKIISYLVLLKYFGLADTEKNITFAN